MKQGLISNLSYKNLKYKKPLIFSLEMLALKAFPKKISTVFRTGFTIGWGLLAGGLLLNGGGGWAQTEIEPLPGAAGTSLRQTGLCPTDLETLMPLLLRDLPGYANRVMQRARVRDRSADISGYILLTSPPDIDSPPFDPGNSPLLEPIDPESTVQQVFFTTLERQYGISGFAQIQAHHRLFLTLTDNAGWQLVMMQTIYDGYPGGELLSEPRDSTYGVVAQGIEQWLRDCRAGSVDLSPNF